MGFLVGLLFFGLGGCSTPLEPVEPEYVMKTDLLRVTPEAFEQELDVKLAAYPFDLKQTPLAYNEVVLELVSILSEEIVVLSAAKDQQVRVQASELLAAENFYREDYPEESFDKMLLEKAISYGTWKKRLEKTLIMDKFIQQALTDRIEITAQDLVSFYDRHMEERAGASFASAPEEKKLDEKRLLAELRLEKSEESYDDWLLELKKTYPLYMNEQTLARFLIK